MKIIGITGPSGAGKSLLSEYLAQKGYPVINADEVYHSLLIPPSDCLDALALAFGKGIFFANGTLNRPALSDIVFHDEAKLALLNETVLGFVLQRVRSQILALKENRYEAVVIDAPTLIESGFHRECDVVISVLSTPELRMQRIMERDGLSKERALARIEAQQPDEFYRAQSDHVLTNCGDRALFIQKIEALLISL